MGFPPPKMQRPSEDKLVAIKRALDRYEYGADMGQMAPLMAQAYQKTELEQLLPALVDALADSRVLIPVFPHQVTEGKAGEKEPCQEGELYSRLLPLGGGKIKVAELYSDIDRLQKYQPEARPVPVAARSFAAFAYENPGRAILDGEIFLPRPALAAIATAGKWLPSWENTNLLQQIRELAADLPRITPMGIKPQYRSPDILLVQVADKSSAVAQEITQMQQRLFRLQGIGEQVDMLVVAPIIATQSV